MITEIGSILFKLGLSVAFVSFFSVGLIVSAGLSVPQVLVEASGLMNAVVNRDLTGLVQTLSTTLAGLGMTVGILNVLSKGAVLESIKATTLALYLGLIVISLDGIYLLLNLFIKFLVWWIPFISGTVFALKTTVQVITAVLVPYYMLVRTFGMPAE